MSTFKNLATRVFYKKLIDAECKNTFVKKMEALKKVVPFLTNDILTSKKDRFVLSLSKLFMARTKMQEHELLTLKKLLSDSLHTAIYVVQKDKIRAWIEKIDTEEIEHLIDNGLLQIRSSNDVSVQIKIYNNTLALFRDPLAKDKIDLFFYSLNRFMEQKDHMNFVQLDACTSLIKRSRFVLQNFSQYKKALDWATILKEHELDLDFRARLADASESKGVQQVEKYKAMVPFINKRVSSEHRQYYVHNVKKLLAEKMEEIKALKKVLGAV
jgi:hypothetical protein